MKKSIVLTLLFISAIASAQDNADEDTTARPVITETGKPVGKKTETKVSKDGSILESSDGMVKLIIPAGAVSNKTVISIQPITNLMPNGNGKAYRLEPSGIQFQKPVHIIFQYDGDEYKNSMQQMIGIAMQDNTGQWYCLKKFLLDTLAKTISGDINHFSDWSKFDELKIDPSYARLKVKKSMSLTISLITADELGDELMQLIPVKRKKIPWRGTWMANEIINGNATEGKISATSRTSVKYTAPAAIPPKNPVAVTAELTGIIYKSVVKGRTETFEKLRLVSNILIYDNAYELTMVSSSDAPAGSVLGTVTYKDTGSLVVSITGSEAKIIEKVNRNIPDKLDYIGKCQIVQQKPGSGNIHILGASSIKLLPPVSPGGNSWVEIIFKRAPTIFPVLLFNCPPVGRGSSWYKGDNRQANAFAAQFLAAYPQQVKFEAKEGEQTILLLGKEGSEVFVKFSVKQIKDE